MLASSLTKKSENRKTGPIPISYSSSDTCPDACPLKAGGCYAKWGYTRFHWAGVDKQKLRYTFNTFLENVKRLSSGQLWRHNIAGDLPGTNNGINREQLDRLVKANKGKKGFTYTHKPMLARQGTTALIARRNRSAVKAANKNGFTVNLSSNDLDEADRLLKLKIGPVVTLVNSTSGNEDTFTPAGNRVKICPAYTDNRTCATCAICQKGNRKFIVGFPAHGTMKNKVNEIANG